MNKWQILAVNIAWRVLKKGPHSKPQIRRRNRPVVVPFAAPPAANPRMRIAAVLHIFYPELAPALRKTCENIHAPVDVYVSTDSEAKAAAIRATFAGWGCGELVVKICPNRGRDMLSKFVAFPDALQTYDLLLFLHSKKSTHLEAGEHDWGQVLIETLAGSPAIVDSILALFAADPTLGIVAPDHYDSIRRWANWGGNRRGAEALAQRMGIEIGRARALDFPGGSMFWCRPAALKPLFDLHLTAADFPDELGQIDKTLAHALERLFFFAAEQAGYGWLQVVHPDHYADRGNRLRVAHAADLAATMRRAAMPLFRG